MKFSLPVFVFAALAFFTASAQDVSVEVSLDQDQFLPSETLPVTVKVTNRSGQTLHLGADANWLTFNVESVDGPIALKIGDAPVTGEFTLESSQVATKRVDLQPYFILTRPGIYKVTATLRIKDWNAEVTSEKQNFDVISGARLWSQEFGVPAPGGMTNQAPEVRKYTLEEANYLRQQLRMYVMVTDASESRVFKVSAVGPMVSFSQPEAQLDRFSNLHVLYQSGSSAFTYSIVNPNGEIARQEIYDYFNTRPRLGMDDAGGIVVIGGVRRVKAGELPEVKTPLELPPQKKP
jgi:hypothetical protein